jgi:hypothetical protein
MLLLMHMLSNHILLPMHKEVSLIKSCLVPLYLTCFSLITRSLSGEYFFISKGGEYYFKRTLI